MQFVNLRQTNEERRDKYHIIRIFLPSHTASRLRDWKWMSLIRRSDVLGLDKNMLITGREYWKTRRH